MSERPEAANLVKLSGNFLIAATIEALGEGEELEIRRWTARLGDGYQPVYSTDFDAVRLR